MAFIGIDREIENHWIYQDAEYFKVWFEILLRARFSLEPEKKMMDGKFVVIEYGQFIYGRISWSDRLKVSEQRLRTLFKKLIDDEMIELIQTFPKFTLYSVKNYAKYNQQSNQQQILAGQGKSEFGNQQINDTPTSSQPAANQQLTTQEQGSNKVNKVTKKVSKTYTPEFEEFWSVYPRKIQKQDAFKAWEKNIKNNESPTIMIQCASNYAKDCEIKQTEEQYIKHPKTFLNAERYKDFMVIVLSQPRLSAYERKKNIFDQMLADEEAKARGEAGYYQTGTDYFS